MTVRIGGNRPVMPAAPRATEGMGPGDQAAILKLISAEKKASAAKGGKNIGKIVPMYIAPGPGIVAKYMVVPPWAGIDGHNALINKITKDGKVGKREALLVRKMFNHDIAEAKKEGRDITKQVAAYLHKVLGGKRIEKVAWQTIFGLGGPGYEQPRPIYILPPRPR